MNTTPIRRLQRLRCTTMKVRRLQTRTQQKNLHASHSPALTTQHRARTTCTHCIHLLQLHRNATTHYLGDHHVHSNVLSKLGYSPVPHHLHSHSRSVCALAYTISKGNFPSDVPCAYACVQCTCSVRIVLHVRVRVRMCVCVYASQRANI